MIGLCGFAADPAFAQAPAACPANDTVVYFALDSASLNSEQDFALFKMAEASRKCGEEGVLVHTSGNAERARIVANVLAQRGVKATIIAQPALLLGGDTMLARSITLRVATGVSANS